MTPTEAAALLAVAAAFDNRKPDADAATAWATVLDGARFEDCRDSIVAYYRRHREWIMPSDVLAGVKEIRWGRIEAFDRICRLEPPAQFRDDPAAEIEWYRNVRQNVADGVVTHPDQVNERGDLKPYDVAALGQLGRTVPTA